MIKRNLIANFLGQGWTALMGLAFIPVYIKYLGIEAYGLIGIFAVLHAWLTLLDVGMTPTLGREMARFTGGGDHGSRAPRLVALDRGPDFRSCGGGSVGCHHFLALDCNKLAESGKPIS